MYRSPYGDRNRKIAEFVETYDWSYQLVADKFGVTRNAVAGIMFRRKHPYSERVRTPNSKSKTKIGTGYKHQSYYPSINAINSTVRG